LPVIISSSTVKALLRKASPEHISPMSLKIPECWENRNAILEFPGRSGNGFFLTK
jgi:hypothetical protein